MTKHQLEREALGVPGFASPRPHLEPSRAGLSRDRDIATAISLAIYWITTIPQENVRITVHKGYVTLEGWLEALHQKQFLEQIVRQVSGVKDISNLIKIA